LVRALEVHGTELFAGGWFLNAGDVNNVHNVAAWDGTQWRKLGTGLRYPGGDPRVFALLSAGSDLYAGGVFTRASGIAMNRIARWDGSAWNAVGFLSENMIGGTLAVMSLGEFNGDLVAGGSFRKADLVIVNGIARWDGSSWHPLGPSGGLPGSSGANDWVECMASYGGRLIVGGDFTEIGGVPANGIAAWDGSSWSALGSGLEGTTSSSGPAALTVYNGDLIAGGEFFLAGGSPAANIARWDGTSWHPIGGGVDNKVYGLATHKDHLYAAGWFVTAGTDSASKIARWDGTDWYPLGSGVGSGLWARPLEEFMGHLYVGGNIFVLGGKPSYAIGRWYQPACDTDAPLLMPQLSGLSLGLGYPNPFERVTTVNYELPAAARVALVVYDATGRRVRTLESATRLAGVHAATWDGRDDRGRRVAGGTYFVKLSAGDNAQTRKVVFLGGE